MSVDIECVVVGAGVVGLAVARELAQAGHEVLLIEAGGAIGMGTSSRSSEVIHAGIYYPPGSLKARLCVEGRHRLYAYCESHGVTTRRLGKLIVAKDPSQVAGLETADLAILGTAALRTFSTADIAALIKDRILAPATPTSPDRLP